MSIQADMSTATSEISSTGSKPSGKRVLAAVEVLILYAGILLYIWRWQYSHPLAWIPLLGLVLLSRAFHRDSLHRLGLTGRELAASARLILPLAAVFFIPALIYGFAAGRIPWTLPRLSALRYFGGYLIWCSFQQYLAQSFFHNRLMPVVRNRHASSLLVALMFGGAHIPNPILMAATALGGFVLCEIFARHRNIWPLAVTQAVAGVLIGTLAPAALIHNMRVGPGYFFYKPS
jgi:Type II CAAX prenyl endopeptidase Rce1-like